MSEAPLLELKQVHINYGPICAIQGIDLKVEKGEIVAILGANGAGKTTTLQSISGLHPAAQGEIFFGGQPIQRAKPHQIVRLGIAQSPEGRRVFPHMSVQENLEMGAYLRKDKVAIKKDLEHILKLFPRLQERYQQLAGTLSGGEQQILAIARALMAAPQLLLLDEPSLGMAPKLVKIIFEAIKEINRQGVSILLVEQNARAALKIAHRGYVLKCGQMQLNDKAENLMSNPQVQQAYLGH